jgi:hypothetical protein
MKSVAIVILLMGGWFTTGHSVIKAQDIPSRDVYVANPLNRTMKFSIVCDSGDKKDSTKHQLNARSSDLYKCSSSGASPFVRVVTGHKKPVLVKLEPKKRYEFYWNSEKSQWEVREIAPRT